MGTVACNVGHSPFEPAPGSLSLGPPYAGLLARLVIPLGEHLDAEVGGIWLAQCRAATSVKVSKLCLGAVRSRRCRRPSSSWTNWSNGPAHWPREAFARLGHLSCVPPSAIVSGASTPVAMINRNAIPWIQPCHVSGFPPLSIGVSTLKAASMSATPSRPAA
jgi:hypothetical protein